MAIMLENREQSKARAVSDIVPSIARECLIAPEPPWRMPTVRDLALKYQSSISSIHVAIARLREDDAISVETRGPLGAFMVRRSMGRLWELAERGPLVIALPLASSPRYEAVATAIKQLLTQTGLEVFLIFVRGSRQRLQAVREGRCNLAVMSSFAAAELCGEEDRVVVELLPNSYNTGHRVFFSSTLVDGKPMRVIVDRFSADQQLLTALEFGTTDVQLLPAMTGQIARMLADGHGDAAIWTADEMQVNRPPGILDRPLSPAVRERLGGRETQAVLVGRADHAEVLAAVTRSLDASAVEHIQTEVMAGRIVPEY
jgi:hypothetical protein